MLPRRFESRNSKHNSEPQSCLWHKQLLPAMKYCRALNRTARSLQRRTVPTQTNIWMGTEVNRLRDSTEHLAKSLSAGANWHAECVGPQVQACTICPLDGSVRTMAGSKECFGWKRRGFRTQILATRFGPVPRFDEKSACSGPSTITTKD